MKKMLLVCAMLTAAASQAQIVNIEARRLRTDSVRFAGDFNMALLLNSTNGKDIVTIRGNTVLQWKSANFRHLWLGVANYDFAKAEEQSFVNNFYVHIRYNYKINNWLRWEALLQSQTNEPLGIDFRQLIGTGPRFKIRLGTHSDIYLGTTYLYEYEQTIRPNRVISRDHRSSNYGSINIYLPKVNGSFVSTLYYQPLYSEISDFRIMNDTRLDISITAKWRVYTRFSYLYDSRPPLNIRRNAMNLEQGFGFSIK